LALEKKEISFDKEGGAEKGDTPASFVAACPVAQKLPPSTFFSFRLVDRHRLDAGRRVSPFARSLRLKATDRKKEGESIHKPQNEPSFSRLVSDRWSLRRRREILTLTL